MRICVYGAGAIGGHLAAKLGAVGHDVSVVCRGAHLQAIRENGITLRVAEKSINARVAANDGAAGLGIQDFVIVTLKQMALPAFADDIAPLLGAETAVVFVQNGIPWWYAIGLGAGRPAPPDLGKLDPGGRIARAIAPERVIGAVIYTSNEVIEPGVIQNDSVSANTLIVGEANDLATSRIGVLRDALDAAGVASPVCADIRAAMWRRLLVNMSGSAVCSIIEQPIGPSLDDPAIAALYQRLTREGTAVALAHGVIVAEGTVPPGPPTKFPPQHKPSIFQDYEKRRPMEIEAILKTPLAFARAAGIETPAIETIAALAAHRATKHGLYHP